MTWTEAILLAASSCLALAVALASLFLLAGIEGYETNGWLKPFFSDLVQAGASGREIAAGILAKTLCHWDRRALRIGLAAAAAAIFAMGVASDRLHRMGNAPFMNWLSFSGIYLAAHVGFALRDFESLTLPGALLWFRGVRRGYERRLDRSEEGATGLARAVGRALLFLGGALGTVLVPFAIYGWVGEKASVWYQVSLSRTAGLEVMCLLAAAYAIAGAITGRAWGGWARRNAERNFNRLAEELDRLFEMRREWIFDRPQ